MGGQKMKYNVTLQLTATELYRLEVTIPIEADSLEDARGKIGEMLDELESTAYGPEYTEIGRCLRGQNMDIMDLNEYDDPEYGAFSGEIVQIRKVDR